MRKMFAGLVADDTPMVRRAAAKAHGVCSFLRASCPLSLSYRRLCSKSNARLLPQRWPFDSELTRLAFRQSGRSRSQPTFPHPLRPYSPLSQTRRRRPRFRPTTYHPRPHCPRAESFRGRGQRSPPRPSALERARQELARAVYGCERICWAGRGCWRGYRA